MTALDLTRKDAWHRWDVSRFDDVIESNCKRFSIVRSITGGAFVAFRKFEKTQTGYTPPPVVLGGFDDADKARAACRDRARQEAAT